jgi:general secretion pathway protein A
VPRRINLLADRALLGAYTQIQLRADRRTVEQAAREVFATATHRCGGGVGPMAHRVAVGAGRCRGMVGLAAAARSAEDGRSGAGPAGAERCAGWLRGADAAVPAPTNAATALAVGLAASAAASTASGAGPATMATSAAPGAGAASAPNVLAGPATQSDPSALLAAAHADAAIAWRELALRWNVAIGEGDPCVAAQQAQLACFRSPPSGGLPAVRQLARPGVLTLRNADGQPRYAVLVAVTDRRPRCSRRPQLRAGPACAGRRLARRVRHVLAHTAGLARRAVIAAPGSSNNSRQRLALRAQPLRERVHAFQLAEGLPPDGWPAR